MGRTRQGRRLAALRRRGRFRCRDRARRRATRIRSAPHRTRRVPGSPAEAERFHPRVLTVGSTADAVLAFVSAGVGRTAMMQALGYLRRQVSPRPRRRHRARRRRSCRRSTPPVAIRDTFGGTNLRADDPRHARNGRALRHQRRVRRCARGARDRIAAEDHAFERRGRVAAVAQCPDGGWAYDKPYDSGDRRRALRRLRPTTDFFYVGLQHDVATWCRRWRTCRTPTGCRARSRSSRRCATRVHHGWAYPPRSQATDANSTALVIQAYRRRPACPGPRSHRSALREAAEPRVRRVRRSRGARASAAAPTGGDDRRDPRSAARCRSR